MAPEEGEAWMRDSRVYTLEQHPPKTRMRVGAHILTMSMTEVDSAGVTGEEAGLVGVIEPLGMVCPFACS